MPPSPRAQSAQGTEAVGAATGSDSGAKGRKGRRAAAAAEESAPTVEFAQLGGDGPTGAGGEGGESDAMSAEELLSIPPRADNLAEELAARPQRARLPKITLALAAGFLIAVGFIGGVLAQKHYGGASTAGGRASALASTFAGARGTGAGRGGFGGGTAGGGTGAGGFGGSSITGSITVVSGDTLYITSTTGTVYTVKTSGSTSVELSSSGSLSQLKPGQTVTISGTAGSGGTVNATTITAGN
jgi:hypothetical protein